MTQAAVIPIGSASRAKPVKEHMSRKEAAAYLTSIGYTIAPQTLANMASNNNDGRGPPFTRSGWRAVSYARTDLDAWLQGRKQRVS